MMSGEGYRTEKVEYLGPVMGVHEVSVDEQVLATNLFSRDSLERPRKVPHRQDTHAVS